MSGDGDGIARSREPKRTPEQNARMWAMLRDVAKQVPWPVNGLEQYITPEDYKDIFSAELHKEQRIAQGLSGGFVLLGLRTRNLRVREESDLIELMFMFGAQRGVVWSNEANKQEKDNGTPRND